jgi:hypothetical protein
MVRCEAIDFALKLGQSLEVYLAALHRGREPGSSGGVASNMGTTRSKLTCQRVTPMEEDGSPVRRFETRIDMKE